MLAHLRHQPISASFPLLIPSQRRHASNQVTIRKHIAKVVRKYRVPENQSAVPGEKEDTEAFRIRKVIAGPKPEEYTGEVTIRKFPIGYNPMNPKHVPKEKEYIPGELPVKCKITTILTAHGSVANKTRVLTSFRNSLGRRPRRDPGKPFDAALVLASPSLTSWLEDPDFMVPLLRMTGRNPLATSIVPPAEGGLSVLSAVVDGLLMDDLELRKRKWEVKRMKGVEVEVSEGLAVVQGYRDELLPGLWEGEKAGEGKAGLVFRLPGLGPDLDGTVGREEREMDVAVPVANTVFQNGRTSTMFASRWEGGVLEPWRVAERVDVGKRVVRLPTEAGEEVGVSVPLVSITPLRPVQAALGNILKTLLVDGEAVPASKELEANVPKLLESRSRMGLGEIQGPLNVWALVVPARLGLEWQFGALRRLHVQRLLEEGCRLHRVLSGGGGWGAKQGLLSLDPDSRFETTDEEDVERFERDFLARRLGGSGGGSVVGPGDRVVFCVDAATYPKPGSHVSQEWAPLSKSFKVQVRPETTTEGSTIQRLGNVGIRRVDDFFGVVSTAMFVAPVTAADGEGGDVLGSMKIDTRGAELSVGKMLEEAPEDTIEDTIEDTMEDTIEDVTGSLGDESASELGARHDVPTFETLLQNHESQWAKFVEKTEKTKAEMSKEIRSW